MNFEEMESQIESLIDDCDYTLDNVEFNDVVGRPGKIHFNKLRKFLIKAQVQLEKFREKEGL